MSDINISGIPNMGFAGGGGGVFGGIPNVAPAMSAAQINAGMWGNYSPGQAQSTLNNIYGAGGFGAQPAYHAGLAPLTVAPPAASNHAPAAPPASVFQKGAAPFRGFGLPGGGGTGSFSPQASRYSGGGIGSDAARAPAAAYSHMLWARRRVPSQTTPNSGGGIGSDAYRGAAARGMTPTRLPAYSGGGIGSDARYGGQNTLSDLAARYQSMLSPARSGGIGSDARYGGQKHT